MTEGLEVTIKYRGAKHDQVAFPTSSASEFAVLKKDLAHLRVHSPSQKNVRRVNGSFILHWPTAGTSVKVDPLADSLHVRWFKLCSDDPEPLKLREFLSIESITLMQNGVMIRSTASSGQASQDAPQSSLANRLSDQPLPEIAQQPAPASAPAPSTLVKSQPPPPPPPPLPKVPPSAPRLDRQPPHLKRHMSAMDGPSSVTRQKLDMLETQPATPLRSINTQLQPTQLPTSPRADRQRGLPGSPTAGNAAKTSSDPTRDDGTSSTNVQAPAPPDAHAIPPSPPREPGEMTPHTPLPTSTLLPRPSPPGSSSGFGPRPPPLHHPTPSISVLTSPYPSSSSSGSSDPHASRLRDRDVSRLMRELWDTRRQLTAMQAHEQVILDDLERLGARSDGTSASANATLNGVLEDELVRLEAELRAEKGRRVHAERALSDVERECRAPFVVPALFQAFMSISELS